MDKLYLEKHDIEKSMRVREADMQRTHAAYSKQNRHYDPCRQVGWKGMRGDTVLAYTQRPCINVSAITALITIQRKKGYKGLNIQY